MRGVHRLAVHGVPDPGHPHGTWKLTKTSNGEAHLRLADNYGLEQTYVYVRSSHAFTLRIGSSDQRSEFVEE